jgi:hypothetical protein
MSIEVSVYTAYCFIEISTPIVLAAIVAVVACYALWRGSR